MSRKARKSHKMRSMEVIGQKKKKGKLEEYYWNYNIKIIN